MSRGAASCRYRLDHEALARAIFDAAQTSGAPASDERSEEATYEL